MNQNNEYVEDELEEGITFKKVGYFIKKGWLRTVIYVLACVLLVTVIALPIKVFYKSEPMAITSIEFIYSGIEEGKAPDGKPFSKDSIITTTVLAAAVDKAGFSDKISDISKFANSVRVEAVNTDEYVALVNAAANGDADAANTLRNYKMNPTKFNIIISYPDKLGLNDAQAVDLLDKLVECYYEEYRDNYSVMNMFSAELYKLSSNNDTEFTDMYDMYAASLDAVETYLTTLAEENPAFVSTKNNTTFNQLLSELNLLNSNLDLFNAYIATNNVWRNSAAAQSSLEKNKTDIMLKLEPMKEYIKTLETQIASIKPNTIKSYDANGNEVTTEAYPSEYYKFHNLLDDYNRQVLEANIQLASINTRLKQFENGSEGGDSHKNNAMATIVGIEKTISTYIQKVNNTINDYFEASYITSSVRRVQPPVVTRRSSGMNILIIYGVAVIVGLLVSCLVTAIKISMANGKRKIAEAEKRAALDNAQNSENTENK